MTFAARNKRNAVLRIIFLLIMTILQLIPIFVIILNSLRTNEAIERSLIGFPASLYFHNFVVAWNRGGYTNGYITSISVGLGTAIAILILDGMAVYGFNKLKCFFQRFFRLYFVGSLAIPSFAILVPLYFMFNKLNLVDNRLGLAIIFIATNISFNFIFLDAFFQAMPKELDEAARIDGASEFQNIMYITIPMAKPILSSIMLIAFVRTWNEFLFSNIFVTKDALRTVSLRFFIFVGRFGGADYGYVYAAALISIIPILVIYLLSQDSFVSGMTAGSVKG